MHASTKGAMGWDGMTSSLDHFPFSPITVFTFHEYMNVYTHIRMLNHKSTRFAKESPNRIKIPR